MNWIVEGNRVQAPNGNAIDFQFDIREWRELPGKIVVILDVPPGRTMTENVFCIASTAQLLWQIERIPETSTDNVNRYLCFFKADPFHVLLGNWSGDNIEVDVATGKAKWVGNGR